MARRHKHRNDVERCEDCGEVLDPRNHSGFCDNICESAYRKDQERSPQVKYPVQKFRD